MSEKGKREAVAGRIQRLVQSEFGVIEDMDTAEIACRRQELRELLACARYDNYRGEKLANKIANIEGLPSIENCTVTQLRDLTTHVRHELLCGG